MTSATELPMGERHDVAIPCDVDALPTTRRRLRDTLSLAGLPAPLIADVVTVASELLMNAMVHGEPDGDGCIAISWSVLPRGSVWLRVHDSGSPTEVSAVGVPPGAGRSPAAQLSAGATSCEPFAAGGRGLRLVEGLARTWSVDRRTGTSVTAVIGPSVIQD